MRDGMCECEWKRRVVGFDGEGVMREEKLKVKRSSSFVPRASRMTQCQDAFPTGEGACCLGMRCKRHRSGERLDYDVIRCARPWLLRFNGKRQQISSNHSQHGSREKY